MFQITVAFAIGVIVGICVAICGLVFTWLCEDYYEAHPKRRWKKGAIR